MNFQDAVIGTEVVRSKGDYVVGRVGQIIERDVIKQRVRVGWRGYPRTWVSVDSVEPTSIGYEIIPMQISDITGRRTAWPAYRRK